MKSMGFTPYTPPRSMKPVGFTRAVREFRSMARQLGREAVNMRKRTRNINRHVRQGIGP